MRSPSAIAVLVVLILIGSAPIPADASKYNACTLLSAGELETVVGGKVSKSSDGDYVIPSGPYKGVTMSMCTWAVGPTYAFLSVIPRAQTPQQEAAGLAALQRATDRLKQRGWRIERADIPGTFCVTIRPPANAANARPGSGCMLAVRSLTFSLYVIGGGVAVQQVKALADKVAARLP